MTAPAAIGASALSVDLSARRILDQVSLEAAGGEFVGIIGPNGAGKSTLLRTLATLLRPSAGQVLIDGHDAAAMSPGQVAKLAASVPQNPTLDFAFAVREVVLMGRHPHLGRFAVEGKTDHTIAERSMHQAGVAAFADRSIATLSGGERQMVFLAKALCQEPRILLLDEPVSALDIRHQLDVLCLVQQLAHDNGIVAIAVLHDLNLAARFCDRLILLANGSVLAMGSPQTVLTPATLRQSYRVRAVVCPDPNTGALSVTALAVDDDVHSTAASQGSADAAGLPSSPTIAQGEVHASLR